MRRRWTALALALAGCAALLVAVAILVGDRQAPDGTRADIVPAAVDAAAHVRTSRRAEVDARFGQAIVMLHARRYDHAIAALHRVLELEPRMPEAHVNMGYALIGTGNARAARDFFSGAIALRATQANAWFGLAIASEALGDRPQAIGAMRTYVHLADENDPARRRAMSALWEWQAARGQHEPEPALPAVARAGRPAAARTDSFGFPCFGTAGLDCVGRAPALRGNAGERPPASALLGRTDTEGGGARRTTP